MFCCEGRALARAPRSVVHRSGSTTGLVSARALTQRVASDPLDELAHRYVERARYCDERREGRVGPAALDVLPVLAGELGRLGGLFLRELLALSELRIRLPSFPSASASSGTTARSSASAAPSCVSRFVRGTGRSVPPCRTS